MKARITSVFALSACLASLGVADLHGSSVLKRNLRELAAIAELIIVGGTHKALRICRCRRNDIVTLVEGY